ncbi:Ankyrin repeat and MYND domain-containing protein 2 [Echinococcus granulosus]|uniref:Ankyrin repeat and MYND domain-containing protein 2 n=1 Tax=Echinococcus granulosus TaxID=6210 RepID=W6U704_ECHGR|nr:Ankyrin repeat and MYND domain-containing protein 2 [Echinococcus granulosus]EUB57008.1 Ankyrin repeat and MYND domain-containing protein 2 [Echinococcus granulosus]
MDQGLSLTALSSFHNAVLDGDVVKVKAFLTTGLVKVDEPDEVNINLFSNCLQDGMTALLQACYRGNVEIAKILVDSGADVNWSKHRQEYTALMFAALSGKLEIINFLLSCGAKPDMTNCLKRTAAEMASFVGNHFAAAQINTYIEKEELIQFTKKSAAENSQLSTDLVEPLHHLVTNLNFAPVKVFLYLSSAAGKSLLESWKNVVAVLEKLVEQHFTPQRTHEHIAIKLHLLCAMVRRAGEYLEAGIDGDDKEIKAVHEEKNVFALEPLIKNFLRGTDPHGLPKGQEAFLRKCLVSFPHAESTLWRQTVTQIGGVEVGQAPTCLTILENAINGFSSFSRSTSRDGIINEPCATCSDMPSYAKDLQVKWCSRCHEAAYCSVACQKLHWFTHKKYCPILKEHHESVARSQSKEKAKPTEEEMSNFQEEISAYLPH